MSNDINEWKGRCYELESKVKYYERLLKAKDQTIEYHRVQLDILSEFIAKKESMNIPSIVIQNATLVEGEPR